MDNGKNILIAALAGAAVGVTAGILFAPAKGSETREKIGDKLGNAKDKVIDKTEDVVEKIASFKKTVADKKDDIKENVRQELLSEIEKLEAKLKQA